MDRRTLMLSAVAPLVPGIGMAASAANGFVSVNEARKAVDGLAAGWRTRSGWALPQVLVHLAQSIEFSMTGFPQPKPALFQATLGTAAFAFFDARGRMSHSLTEPIPGAPSLEPPLALEAALARLNKALSDFERFDGPLQPHFAYGKLSKPQYSRAHLMHLADHWTEFVRS
jgi:Protein of unknown function (DUF1569)